MGLFPIEGRPNMVPVQEYIQQKVNPILENLVTQLLLERPDQPAPFMIKMLGEKPLTLNPCSQYMYINNGGWGVMRPAG